MKKKMSIFLVLCSCSVATMLRSCAEGPIDGPGRDPVFFVELTQQDKDRYVYQDTITPPNNPLLPSTNETYSISGVLGFSSPFGVSQYYASVRGVESKSVYYFASGNMFLRFDEPMLQPYHIGDTLCVRGRVTKSPDYEGEFRIHMQEVSLIGAYVKPSKDE